MKVRIFSMKIICDDIKVIVYAFVVYIFIFKSEYYFLSPGMLQLRKVEASLNLAEERLEKKKQEVINLEDQLSEIKQKYDSEYESKLRDALKKARENAEDGWKSRLQIVESSFKEENDGLKRELQNATKIISVFQSGLRSDKLHIPPDESFGVPIVINTEDFRTESLLKNVCSKQEEIIESLKHDNKAIAERYAKSLEELKAIEEENKVVKHDASLAVTDNQVVYNALIQATQRLHDADIVTSNLRADNSLLSKRFESASNELIAMKKCLQENGERTISMELDNKHLKSDHVEQLNQTSAKIKELENMNLVLIDQVKHQELALTSSKGDFDVLLERKSHENTQLRDALLEAESKYQSAVSKINHLQSEIKINEEKLLEKDSTLKSTRREHELEVLSLQQVRNDMKIDIDNLKDNLLDEKSHKKELEDKYANDLLTIEKEIEITMPTIVDDIASKVNRNWEKRMKAEIGSMQLKYESEIESLRKEILEIHSSFAERDARRRVQLVDEKAEIEDMRLLVAGLKQTMGITSDPSVSFHHSHNLIPILNPTSRSYLTDSEVVEPLNDIGEQSEKLRCKEKEQRYKRSSIEAFSQLQAQVNTMKHELTNTITSKMKAPLKLLKTESDLFGAFEGNFFNLQYSSYSFV